MKVTIRPATLADSELIFALVEQFATSFVPVKTAFAHSFTHVLSDESACVLVAEFENTIVGYCLAFDHSTFYANGRVTWVEEIMVQDTMCGQGIGNALMQSVETWALTRESKLVSLATRRAASFYKAIGYAESGVYYRKLLGVD